MRKPWRSFVAIATGAMLGATLALLTGCGVEVGKPPSDSAEAKRIADVNGCGLYRVQDGGVLVYVLRCGQDGAIATR